MSLYSTTPGTLIVALDIGKNVHWFGAYRYEGRLIEVVAPLKVRSDTAGFARFTATVDPLLATGRFPAALFGNEHTGVYHEPWAWLIHAHYLAQQPSAACPITYRWLNPLLTKKRQEGTSVRQHTSDRTAVVAVGVGVAGGGKMSRTVTPVRGAGNDVARTANSVLSAGAGVNGGRRSRMAWMRSAGSGCATATGAGAGVAAVSAPSLSAICRPVAAGVGWAPAIDRTLGVMFVSEGAGVAVGPTVGVGLAAQAASNRIARTAVNRKR